MANQANLCRHLNTAALETPTALAVAVQKEVKGQLLYDEITFAQLDQKSDEIAFALNDFGLKSGMKAVLMVTPSIDFFALTFALFKAGIIPILVDPGMGIKNLKQCFIESKPDAFIGIGKAQVARKIFSWGKPTVRFVITVGKAGILGKFFGGINLAKLVKYSHLKRQIAQQENFNSQRKADLSEDILPQYPMVKLTDHQMAAILFTSGSTGVPKGVVYSHQMFEAQITTLKDDYNITSGERDLATFPLFSLFGPALGMASIIPEMDASQPIKANPDYIFAAIERYQCSNLFANPALIEVLGQAGEQQNLKLASLKRVISAGAPATLPSIARFSHMLTGDAQVLNSYGATESLPITKIGSKALLETANITDNGGGICVGIPVNGVDIAIIAITEKNIGTWQNELTLPANTIGEIVVKGPMVSQSYYQRESATLQAKIADGLIKPSQLSQSSQENQSEHTLYRHRMGDLGYLDEAGKLWMCGRKAHRVITPQQVFYSIPCERIFNIHRDVKRTALVAITLQGECQALICIELENNCNIPAKQLFEELKIIGAKHQQTQLIKHFIIHKKFPVDIRHNAKIFREKLAVWAQEKYQGGS